MKKLVYMAVAAFTAFAAAGCAKVDELFNGKTEKITFVASFADETRTSIQDGGKVDWVEGDMIRYYSTKNGAIGEYEVVRSGHTTNVVADVAAGTSYVIAAYGGESITDNSVTSFTLNGAVKATQSGKFEDAHVSVAKAFDIEGGASLSFHNMTSLIKFTLERTDVSYITFTANGGEKIHGNGTLKVTFSDDVPSVAFGEDGGNSIKVNTNGAGAFYIATLPVGLSKGFEIKYFDATGTMFAQTVYDKSFVIGSNEMVNLGTLDGRMENCSEFEYVDLGLSVKWATCNLGASSPEEYGGYYQWGGLQDVTSTNIYLDWSNCPYQKIKTTSAGSTRWIKYLGDSKTSFKDVSATDSDVLKTILDQEDDVAHIILGGKWRIPTDAEWTELIENCTWTWTIQLGVKGYKVTSKKSGYDSKYIFLPAAGYRHYDYRDLAGTSGCYWSSTLNPEYPYQSCCMTFSSDKVNNDYSRRCYGLSVRSVYGDRVSVTGVSISKTSLSLEVGTTYTLSAAVAPSNAAEKSVSWISSNTSVATVDANGKVTAVNAGTAIITVKTADGGKTATCAVNVCPASGITIEGQVVALSARSFVVCTNNGYQYVFTDSVPSVKLGDQVSVTGEKSTYNGVDQIDNPSITVKSSGTVIYPAAAVLDAVGIDNYNTPMGYVKFTGILSKSGNYYNIEIPDSKRTGSIAYATADYSSLIGKTIDVTGFFAGISGGSYFNIVATEVKESGSQIDLSLKHPLTSNCSWVLGNKANDNTSTGSNKQSGTFNGTSVDNLVKLGTSSVGGDFTIKVPAGKSKLSFYCIGFSKDESDKFPNTSGTAYSFTATVGSTAQSPVTVKRFIASGNPPFSLNLKDEDDYYTIDLGGATTAETQVKISANGRMLFIGINAE